jgi:hypothetical protein
MRRVNRPQAGCYRNSSVAPGRRNGWKYNIKINALTLDVLPIARKLAMSLPPVPRKRRDRMEKKKKSKVKQSRLKVRDLPPRKDAKGGVTVPPLKNQSPSFSIPPQGFIADS